MLNPCRLVNATRVKELALSKQHLTSPLKMLIQILCSAPTAMTMARTTEECSSMLCLSDPVLPVTLRSIVNWAKVVNVLTGSVSVMAGLLAVVLVMETKSYPSSMLDCLLELSSH